MNRRIIELPLQYQTRLASALESLGYPLEKPGRLAECVLRLSDYYTQNGDAATPWTETWAQVANLCYYFPLNYLRNRAVAGEADRLGFFRDLEALTDCGSGLGSALFALLEVMPKTISANAYDVNRDALRLGAELKSPGMNYAIHTEMPRAGRRSLLSASYVLTELNEPPRQWLDHEALLIVEPGTEQDGRKLLAFRDRLLQQGFHIWAPCTHASACPLMVHSKRDWCHDRIHWIQPDWFTAIERLLPMKNRTLTHSYLLARKSLRPPEKLKSLARLTGDMLIEKGKTRQSVCRGPDREFLAWFPQRMQDGVDLQRGNLIRFRSALEQRSSELRFKEAGGVEEINPTETISD